MTLLTSNDYWSISPLLAISIFAMIALMVDLITPKDQKAPVVFVSFIGLIVTAGCIAAIWGKGLTGFSGIIIADEFSLLFQFILVVIAAISIALSINYVRIKNINLGEYYALLLFSTSGAMLMATSRELITIFVGLEVLSISLYILSGFARTEARSEEAAMKYFLLGSFSSGFFLYGIALIYGGTGSTNILHYVDGTVVSTALASKYTVAGIALLIVGLGFKAGIVPFHAWAPDVYEGAPTSITAFMSAAAKAGAFAAFIRIAAALLPVSYIFHDVIWVLAALTMVTGNILAVQQPNIKRMLAYSSIAHAGYILVGLLAQNPEGRTGVLFYILAYTLMNLGAFGVLILMARRGQELNTIQDLRGLADTDKWAAAAMTVFMLSLAGIPPAVGFMGKLYLFLAAIHANLYGLAYLGLLSSVIGAFYYLRVIISMYFQEPVREFPKNLWSFAPGATVAVAVCAILSLIYGVIPSGLYDISKTGGTSLSVNAVSKQFANKANDTQPQSVGQSVAENK